MHACIVTRTKGIIRVKGDHSDKFLPNNNYYIKVRETEGMRFELLSWRKT